MTIALITCQTTSYVSSKMAEAGGEIGFLQTQTNHPAICHSKVQWNLVNGTLHCVPFFPSKLTPGWREAPVLRLPKNKV